MIRERLTGVGVLLIGLLVFFVLIPAGIDRPGNVEHAALAPDFWPRIIAAVIALMGLLLALRPAREDEGGEGAGDEAGAGEGAAGDGAGAGEAASVRWPQRLPGLAVALGALFAFYFLIPTLGMVASGAALIFGLMAYAGERRWLRGGALAAGIPILLYVFFVYVASIPIPLGVFENLRG